MLDLSWESGDTYTLWMSPKDIRPVLVLTYIKQILKQKQSSLIFVNHYSIPHWISTSVNRCELSFRLWSERSYEILLLSQWLI